MQRASSCKNHSVALQICNKTRGNAVPAQLSKDGGLREARGVDVVD
jgi:hypothetical protein